MLPLLEHLLHALHGLAAGEVEMQRRHRDAAQRRHREVGVGVGGIVDLVAADPHEAAAGGILALGHRGAPVAQPRSEEHTSELPSLMRISYAVFCLNKNIHSKTH